MSTKELKTNQNCNNCNYQFDNDEALFCPNCGQKRIDKLTISSLLETLLSSYFSLDSRLVQTIVPFLFQPGKIAKEFIDGKRRKYMSPSQMYFFFSFLAVLIFSSLFAKDFDDLLYNKFSEINLTFNGLKLEVDENGNLVRNEFIEVIDSLRIEAETDENIKAQLDKTDKMLQLITEGKSNHEIYEEVTLEKDQSWLNKMASFFSYNFLRNKGKGLLITLFSQLTIGFVVALVLFTLLLKFFYIRQKVTIAEHFVHAVYYFSFGFFILSFTLLFLYAFPHFWIVLIVYILLLFYWYKSMRKVYGQKRPKTILKFFLFYFTTTFVILTVVTIVVFLLSMIQYS